MLNLRHNAPIISALGLVLLTAPCSPDKDPEACDKISKACHPFDQGPGTGMPHDCHRLSHTDDAVACTKQLAACVSYCGRLDGGSGEGGGDGAAGAGGTGGAGGAAGSGGSGGSGGAVDAAGGARDASQDTARPADAPVDVAKPPADAGAEAGGVQQVCANYCACMAKQCAKYADIPANIKDPAMCPARCAMFTAQQRMCWLGFCDPNAANISNHNCSHAAGTEGTAECSP
jgi:hypothetical protein